MPSQRQGGREDRFRRWHRRGAILSGLLLALAMTRIPAAAPDALPAERGTQKTGRLHGSVEVGSRLSAKRLRFNLYSDVAQSATPPRAEGGELQNVVVYFMPVPALDLARASVPVRASMRQEGLSFVPHVLAIPKGTSVEFPNGDAIFHNVFSLSRAASFDLGRYPNGSTKSIRFERPGIVKVFCHIHSDMSGVIFVVANPFFAVPDAQGRYTIDGVPPGEYRVTAWHERARPLEKTVVIQPGRTAEVDFSIPLTEETSGGE